VDLKRILFIVLTIILALSLAGTATAAASKPQSIKVVLDGKLVDFVSSQVVLKGKTFVEYSALFAVLGYDVDYDLTTQTIHASVNGMQIEVSVGGDVAFVNGHTVASTGEVIMLNGKTLVGLRFVGMLTGHKVAWSAKTKSISITYQGPTEEQKAAVYDVFNKILLLEASGDYEGLAGLVTSDTLMDIKGTQEGWKTTKTKTVFVQKLMESYSDTVATVNVIDETTKVSGGFFPNNKSQARYTLHKGTDGSWKIYKYELLAIEFTNVPELFDQAVTLPDAEKTAIGKVLNDQLTATNEENVDAYLATLVDFTEKEALKKELQNLFDTATLTTTVEKWTVVAYNGSDKATLLASILTEVDANGTKVKVHGVVVNEAQKVNGKWLLSAQAASLLNEKL
jgi:ketosteroid isomerase-like protein